METTAILEPRKSKALIMIAAGETHAAVAKVLNVDPRTVRRWLKDPEFQQQLKEESDGINALYRHQAVILIGRNVEKSMAATDLLDNIQSTESIPLTLRMRAAGQLLQSGYRWGTFIEKQKVEERRHAERMNEDAAEAERIKETPAPAAPVEKPASEEVKSANPVPVPIPAPAAAAIAQNADKTGQNRTSTAEKVAPASLPASKAITQAGRDAAHAERRARLDRMQREAEAAAAAAKNPVESPLA